MKQNPGVDGGVWWIDQDGSEKAKSFDRQKLAHDFLISIEHAQREGEYVTPAKTTLSEYLGTWIDGYRAEIAPNTERGYQRNIALLKPLIHPVPPFLYKK